MKFRLRWPYISRFEGRIMMAMLLCATVPLIISLVFIPSIIESRLAMSMHPKVEAQLEDSALFFREFFDAKKREYAARARALAREPALRRAVDAAPSARVQTASVAAELLQNLLEAQPELRSLALSGPHDLRLRVHRPALAADGPSRTHHLAVGPRGSLEAVFVLPAKYLEEQDEAAEIALIYRTSRKLESDRARSFYLAYFGILLSAVALSLGLGWWLARAVTRRVGRLAAATAQVASGDMNVHVPVGGKDEIARLTRDFNRMVAEVAEARDRIIYLEKVSGWQDLARRLAHEIKNPLTPIRLAVQELKKRTHARPDADLERLADEVTEVVEEEVEALSRLVDEFSRFARLPAVTPARVEVGQFLHRFVHAYGKYREDVRIGLGDLPQHWPAPIDRVLLRRVLVNLVDNAVEATGTAARIEIRAEVDFGSGRTFIHVEDSGPGVPPELAGRIFEPYFTTKTTGTGLGLAIAKKIVLQHEGTLSLRRSRFGGAAFVIGLPPVSEGLDTADLEEEDEPPLLLRPEPAPGED
ncbi:MAG: ATP-binding protein [Myxococcota bacterium]